MAKPLILFDGVCNLCNGAVNFVIRRDPDGKFQFASLQSGKGIQIKQQIGLASDFQESLILVQEGKAHYRSEAALRIAASLGWPWSWAPILRILPLAVRDWIYNHIAASRYRWFGRRDHCMVPTPELRSRFLEEPSTA